MSRSAILAYWPMIVSIVTIVASASATIVTVSNLQRAVDALEARMLAHERLPGHPEEMARLRAVEVESAKNAKTYAEIQAHLRAIEINVALVCRATKAADCVR